MKECELVIAGGGLTAARAVTSYREAGGYSINVTLIFSLTRHRQIANVKVAYQQY